MKSVILFIALLMLCPYLKAQTKVQNIVDGGKTLIELINIFKQNKSTVQQNKQIIVDSCEIKNFADLCFKNSSNKSLIISMYKRIDETYVITPLTIKILTNAQECLLEIKPGIYKYKIEIENNGTKTILREGDMKLQPCEKMERVITE